MDHKKQTYGWLMAALVAALLAAVLLGLCFGSTPMNIAQVLHGLFHPGDTGVESRILWCCLMKSKRHILMCSMYCCRCWMMEESPMHRVER